MKNIIKIILLIICSFSYGQNPTFSDYEKSDLGNEGLNYIKLLDVDKHSIILKLEGERFIVFINNTAFKYYFDCNKKVKKKKLNLKDIEASFKYLDTLKNVNPSILNITKQKQNINTEYIESIDIQDGKNYSIRLFKEGITITYSTYAPEFFIKERFPFYEERSKVLNAFVFFNSFFN